MIVWLKSAKFWAILVLTVALSILVLVIRALFSKPQDPNNPEIPGYGGLPPAPAIIQQAAEKAHEEALVAKAQSQAITEEKQKQLSDISKIDDGRARRQALSDFINNG